MLMPRDFLNMRCREERWWGLGRMPRQTDLHGVNTGRDAARNRSRLGRVLGRVCGTVRQPPRSATSSVPYYVGIYPTVSKPWPSFRSRQTWDSEARDGLSNLVARVKSRSGFQDQSPGLCTALSLQHSLAFPVFLTVKKAREATPLPVCNRLRRLQHWG